MHVVEFEANNKKLIKIFLRFSIKLYSSKKNYIHPLEAPLIGNKLFRIKGLLHKSHPFHKTAKVKYFMVLKGKEIVGRIACIINKTYNNYYKSNIGHFGFFECIEDIKVSNMLFDNAFKWLKSQGVSKIEGPYNFSINDTTGLLIEGFDSPSYIGTCYNHEYYQNYIEDYGFLKIKDFLALRVSVNVNNENKDKIARLNKIAFRVKNRHNISICSMSKDNKGFFRDIDIIYDIYTSEWKSNWGYVPISREEFVNSVKALRSFYDSDLILFAYYNDIPVAFIVIIPNIYQIQAMFGQNNRKNDFLKLFNIIWNKRFIDQIRVILYAVSSRYRNLGIDSLLLAEAFYISAKKNYIDCEASWVLEDNFKAIRVIQSVGGQIYKKWRIFSCDL